jgi:hypothetical protein
VIVAGAKAAECQHVESPNLDKAKSLAFDAASPRREVDAGLYALSLRLTHTPRSPHERYLSFRIWKIRTWL